MRHPEFPHKVRHVADSRTAKSINALIVVAHGHHRATGETGIPVCVLPRQHFDPGVLQLIGVLKFINQDVAKAPLVVLAHGSVVAQQLVAAQHQLAKVHHAFTLALFFVQRINFNFFAHFLVTCHQVLGSLAIFLAPGDEIHQLFGRKPFVVNIELFAQTFDTGKLVLRVQNLKCGWQIGQLVMRTQKAIAQAMESANPHAPHIDGQHGLQAHHHFLGGLVGERHRQNAARRYLPGLQQPSDARGQHAGFARTGPGQNQRVGGRQCHRCVLLGVKILQEWGI